MYLKSIEVHGFKSFANKILFNFEEGITGIVGPNGSGKSNVADAVRWVLGEQRIKQLRGASMQDVIFSGTELRKPMSYAYVAITLDNSDHQLGIDYDEVTVARRIYRSGESEYLINGTVCRLKDVNELFYDTGIGKEGYSIIGQGQIDKILSGKPEDRRELFDEAAGIVKFKHRKETASKKLESEEANLVRVKDILSELEKTGELPKTVLFSLNPADNEQIGTILGCFQSDEVPGKIQQGPAWWFNDTKSGMEEQMKSLANLGILGNFIGMLTDSRSFLSYTRHDYFRRIMCNMIGKWVENGEYPNDEAALKRIVEGISYTNARRYFGL